MKQAKSGKKSAKEPLTSPAPDPLSGDPLSAPPTSDPLSLPASSDPLSDALLDPLSAAAAEASQSGFGRLPREKVLFEITGVSLDDVTDCMPVI